jgi:hypothetical protein
MKALAYAKTKLLAHDVLGAVFAQARIEHGVKEFPLHNDSLQELFYRFATSGDFPIVNTFFKFSDDGPIPESPKLTEAMARLQLGGLIGRLNPSYELVVVEDTSVDYYNQVVRDRLEPADVEQIQTLAEAFSSWVQGEAASEEHLEHNHR